jgi:eukaryotic-like serine/threonine-protein kinase
VSLVPGSRVGGYEILSRVGSGGMGEVFRGRDLRLKRDAALKVLPGPALADPDRRRRFEHEAQVLAALNHPNVAQLFGVEDDGDVPVIAMEFVDGPTLAERLGAGALPIPDALAIASQLCDGLEAAHERGIVHRDLKPANIKVRPDGLVKILDFGLARGLTSDVAEVSDSTTMLVNRTAEGIVMGTGPYMSPEQARGLPVDRRTDIWAFGCVFYEMLTGTPAFAGSTTTDVLLAVVHQAPDWSRLPPTLPGRIVELIKRCLAKSVKDRQRDIADARFEIERARTPGDESHPLASIAPSPSIWRPLAMSFVAGAVIAGASFALLTRRTPATEPRPIVRTTIALPPDTTLALSRGAALALSPDGRRIVFAGRSKSGVRLYVRALDRFESEPLNGTDDAESPFFSPDGKWVGYFAKGQLQKVLLDRGSPLRVADAPNARGHAWNTADSIYLTPANNQSIWRVPSAGGASEPVTKLRDGELSHRWPTILPGGSTLLFTIWNDTGWEPSRIVAERIGTGERLEVVRAGGGYGRYIRDAASERGFLVYARAEGLLAAPFDESRLALTGQAVPVVDGLVTNLSGGAHFDVSPSGTLAYVSGTLGESVRELKWVAFDGTAEPAAAFAMGRSFMLSPDGTRVVRNNTAGPTRDVWVDDLVRKTSTRLTSQDGNFTAIWSNDGRWVFLSRGIPSSNLYRRAADGSDREERLTTSANSQAPSGVSPDGAWLAFTEIDPTSGADIWVLPVTPSAAAGGSQPVIATARPFLRSKSSEGSATFSPDARWLAYQSNESGRFEVYVRSFPDGERKVQISTVGGVNPIWAPSGRELYFRSLDGKMLVAPVSTAGEFRLEPIRELFNAASYENVYSVTPDGKRFLMMALIKAESSATQIQLVLNFLDELRQRVR